MTAIKMLALDLDGTLAIENHQVSSATRDALLKLHNSGVEVVIATGRRYRTTRYVIDNLGFDVYAICNGGALVKTPAGETHHESIYSASQLANLVHIARHMNLALYGQRDSHSRGGPDFIVDTAVPWSKYIEDYYLNNNEWHGKADLLEINTDFLVTALMGEQQELNQFCEQIHNLYPGMYTTVVVPFIEAGGYYCEIALANVTKWHGLQQLTSIFEVQAHNICAVGDQLNDVPMLEAVGHGVAMGNGNPALHEYVEFICGDHDNDGLLQVIDYIRSHNELLGDD